MSIGIYRKIGYRATAVVNEGVRVNALSAEFFYGRLQSFCG